MVNALSAGWLRTPSGVSPCGVDHMRSPLSRLMATICPYGGFTIERPWTVAPNPPPAGGAAAPRPPPPAAGGRLGGGRGAAGAAGGTQGRADSASRLPVQPP